ncbi:Uncharacterised protein [Citrobacter freundii]|nr:Uncharacterised protein [Citrobacter freundii]
MMLVKLRHKRARKILFISDWTLCRLTPGPSICIILNRG